MIQLHLMTFEHTIVRLVVLSFSQIPHLFILQRLPPFFHLHHLFFIQPFPLIYNSIIVPLSASACMLRPFLQLLQLVQQFQQLLITLKLNAVSVLGKFYEKILTNIRRFQRNLKVNRLFWFLVVWVNYFELEHFVQNYFIEDREAIVAVQKRVIR